MVLELSAVGRLGWGQAGDQDVRGMGEQIPLGAGKLQRIVQIRLDFHPVSGTTEVEVKRPQLLERDAGPCQGLVQQPRLFLSPGIVHGLIVLRR